MYFFNFVIEPESYRNHNLQAVAMILPISEKYTYLFSPLCYRIERTRKFRRKYPWKMNQFFRLLYMVRIWVKKMIKLKLLNRTNNWRNHPFIFIFTTLVILNWIWDQIVHLYSSLYREFQSGHYSIFNDNFDFMSKVKFPIIILEIAQRLVKYF